MYSSIELLWLQEGVGFGRKPPLYMKSGDEVPPPIIDDGQVEYRDGTYATKEQMAIDIVNFLQWAAEPETEHRNKMGVRTTIFLAILLVILIAAKKAVWKNVK